MEALIATGALPTASREGYPQLQDEWHPADELLPTSYVPAGILQVTCALQDLPKEQYIDYEKFFGIEWQPGIICYAYLQEIHYVCKKNEEELPEQYKHLQGYAVPVRVTYVDSSDQKMGG